MQKPLVSAVMITGKSKEHTSLALQAAACFQHQSYPNRELVIVDTLGEVAERCPWAKIVKAPMSTPLGTLRNLGMEAAAGEWIMQWDDDDWHHPMRMESQMQHRSHDSCVLLRWQLRLSLRDAVGGMFRAVKGIHGTILHPRTAARYPTESRRGEDSAFLRNTFGAKRCIVDNGPSKRPGPELYMRFWHGGNTWERGHILNSLLPIRDVELEALVRRIKAQYAQAVPGA